MTLLRANPRGGQSRRAPSEASPHTERMISEAQNGCNTNENRKTKHMPTPATPEDFNRFIQFFPFMLKWEGTSFELDPDDPGGATKFGIDARSHPGVNIAALTQKQAAEIYWREWRAMGCSDMATPLAEVYFDTAENCGVGRARRWLQEMTDAGKTEPNEIASYIVVQRNAHYHSLALAHKSFTKYLRGWLNRTADLCERFSLKT